MLTRSLARSFSNYVVDSVVLNSRSDGGGHNDSTWDSSKVQEVKSKGRIIATVFRISPGARKFPRVRP